jgi:hypothetical protein
MITARRGIVTLDDLRDHLQYAIGLELTTIPAYLCALYSIIPGANTAACEVIQGVVLEKMLHMALAANILNAVGGAPATGPAGSGPSPVPVYPARVPFIDALPVIRLRAFSPTAIDEFIAIERPGSEATAAGDRYGSAGAFYAAIEAGLRTLGTPRVFRRGSEARAGCQLTAENYCGGGPLIEVTDLDSALAAIGEIRREGEGAPGSPRSAPDVTTGRISSPGTCRRATSWRWTGTRSSRWCRTRPRRPTTAPGPIRP